MYSNSKIDTIATSFDPEVVRSFRGHEGAIKSVALSPDM